MSLEDIDTSGFNMMTEHEERFTDLGFLIVITRPPPISVELPTVHVALESLVEAVLFDGSVDFYENFISSENVSVPISYVPPLEGLAVSCLYVDNEEFVGRLYDDTFAT